MAGPLRALFVAALVVLSSIALVAPPAAAGDAPVVASAQAANVALSDALLQILRDGSISDAERALRLAESAVAQRRALVEGGELPARLDASLAAQEANLALARDLLDAVRAGASSQRALGALDAASEARATTTPLHEKLAPQTQRDADAARALLAALPDPLAGVTSAEAGALAEAAMRAQADRLGVAWGAAPDVPQHASPADAVRALLARHGATATPVQAQRVARLDALPEPARGALAGVVDAFVAYEIAAEQAYANADRARFAQLEALGEPAPHLLLGASVATLSAFDARAFGLDALAAPPTDTRLVDAQRAANDAVPLADALDDAGVDLSALFPARLDLLLAAVTLDEALDLVPQAVLEDEPPIEVPPVVGIDLDPTTGSTYSRSYALAIDQGGDDVYRNNAGGSNLGGTVACEAGNFTGAAALLELGGNDDYSETYACAANGGAFLGAGFLFDAGGRDVYGREVPAAAATASAAGGRSLSDPGRLLVGYHSDPGLAPGDELWGASVVSEDEALRFLVVQTDAPASFLAAAARDPNVRYVEPDVLYAASLTPDDPLFGEQTNLVQARVPAAWDRSLGDASRVVCVVDSGVDLAHEDLAGVAWLGGRDLIEDDDVPQDDFGHGTHVAGIVAARTGNGVGVAGVAQVGLRAARVLDADGLGSLTSIVAGIRWCVDSGAHVVSLSLGGPSAQALADAVTYGWDKGALIVAAAGNANCVGCTDYPAAYPEVVAVTCGVPDARCSFSNQGPESEIAAPGVNVLSTLPPCVGFVKYCSDSGYGRLSGTSMSTPLVAAAAALAWTVAPDLTNAQLRQLLRDTASARGPAGCDQAFGYGILDAAALVEAASAGARPAFRGQEACLAPRVQPSANIPQISQGHGVNGGGSYGGFGFLLDVGGDDRYEASGQGANGGGHGLGLGLLVDAVGADRYLATSGGVNGGGAYAGGMLVDAFGFDEYDAVGFGANGGASGGYAISPKPGMPLSTGFLLDAEGSDAYDAGHDGAGLFGTNGGAVFGAGFLLDAAGRDAYLAGAGGVNGGAMLGVGALVDLAGNDTYDTHDPSYHGGNGANGGASLGGAGALIDLDGADVFVGRYFGANGGAVGAGTTGLLLDAGGDDDLFLGCADGANGATTAGRALLVDDGGDDRYDVAPTYCLEYANSVGMNGGALSGPAAGLIVDLSGDDVYVGRSGSNGAGAVGGVGGIVDAGGNDDHAFAVPPPQAFQDPQGINVNGGAYQVAAGFLIDVAGDDRYRAGSYQDTTFGSNGGALANGAGLLVDGAGADEYDAPQGAANGGAQVSSFGFLLDASGADRYKGGGSGANGGAYNPPTPETVDSCRAHHRVGASPNSWPPLVRCLALEATSQPVVGFLRDVAGSDAYTAGALGANGGTSGAGAGLLLDEGGADTYLDRDGGSGADWTKSPKGLGGQQIDLPVQSWPRAVTPPAPPAALAARSEGARDIVLTWEQGHDGELPISSYRVLRDGVLLAELSPQNRSFEDLTARPAVRHAYEVIATNALGAGAPASVIAKAPRCLLVGPDAGGYTCAEVPFAWADTTGGATLKFPRSYASYDNSSQAAPVALPFAFPYYGDAKSEVHVRNNGLVCFVSCYSVKGSTLPPFPEALPGAGAPSDLVACYWSFALPYTTGVKVTTATVGAAPDRAFVIEFNRTDGYAWQTQLHESGEVRCMLKNVFVDPALPKEHAVIGIESPDGLAGLTYRAEQIDARNLGVRFAQVPNAPPIVAGVASATLTSGAPIVFTDATLDPEAAIESWTWDFGDGASSTSAISGAATHAYGARGAYPVTLTVRDDGGNVASASVATVVFDRAPDLVPLIDRALPLDVRHDAQLVATDPDGDALTYSGEGLPAGATLDAATGAFSWTPTQAQLGAHTIRFRASDGILSDEIVVTMTVRTVVADAGADLVVDLGQAAVLSAAGSSGFGLLRYDWDLGDGATASGRTITHAYAALGEYTATLVVTDGYGRTSTDTVLVRVTPDHGLALAPVAPIVGPLAATPGATLAVPLVVTATGNSSDRVSFTVAGSGPGWTVEAPAPVDLAPGESRVVVVRVTAPAAADSAAAVGLVVKAVSENPSVTASFAFSVETPLVVLVTFDRASYGPAHPVWMTVRAEWADGSPVPSVRLRGVVAWDAAGLEQPLSGSPSRLWAGETNATGVMRVLVPHDLDLRTFGSMNGPGRHSIDAVAALGKRLVDVDAAFVVMNGGV